MPTAARPSPVEVLGLDHVVLRVADIEASLEWYRRVLGCSVERRIESFGLYQLRAGTNLIDLVSVASKAGKPGGGAPGKTRRNMEHFALKLAAFDEKKLRRYLKRRGVKAGETARRYGADGHGPSLYLTDPDGNTVELKGPPDADQSERVADAEYPARRRRTSANRSAQA
ncbi:MAG: VOC family protein [Rhodospirillales bacterium]|nr:VOC family protein [Rhodospirillales bacterium]